MPSINWRRITILLCIGASTQLRSQTDLCSSGCSHDQSASIYVPSAPTTLDPEFALRLGSALVHAKEQGLLSKDELQYITSSFRSRQDQTRLITEFAHNPSQFPHAPARLSSHASATTVDLGNIDPFSSPNLIPRLVVALEHEGLYFPFLDDPVHVEVHPTSQLSQDFEFNYFAVYGQMAPPRLSYTDQLQVLKNTASSMRSRLEGLSRDITMNINSTRLINKFLTDISDAETVEAATPNEDAATVIMGQVIGDMYALYRAKSFPTSIPARDAARLFSLYGSLKGEYASARLPLTALASLNRHRDATAKLDGWTLLRPLRSGESSAIQESDTRWGGYVISHPDLWRGGASPQGMMRDAVQSGRERMVSETQSQRASQESSDEEMHWTIQNGEGPVLDQGPAIVQPAPVIVNPDKPENGDNPDN